MKIKFTHSIHEYTPNKSEITLIIEPNNTSRTCYTYILLLKQKMLVKGQIIYWLY